MKRIREVRKREWGKIDGVCVATARQCRPRGRVFVVKSSAFCQQLCRESIWIKLSCDNVFNIKVSLNEWELSEKDDHGAVFTFLHDTLQLQVAFKKATAKKWASEDVEQDIAISFRFLLDSKNSQSCGVMVHKFLEEYIQSKTNWNQKYPKVQHIPLLLHDISVVLSRLRLLGEEILRLKKWGLRFGVLHITCVDKLVEITFSSIKAFVKFELSLAVTSDYPTVPLLIQKFQSHIGNTRVNQIEHIMDSITPAKGYLTKVIARIHNELLNSF